LSRYNDKGSSQLRSLSYDPKMTTKSFPNLSGYRFLKPLFKGTRTIVYQAVRDQTDSEDSRLNEIGSQSVIIKLLADNYPTRHDLLQLRNQYTIAKNLEIPGIIRPYSLEMCGNSYALVMEDFGGISLAQYICSHPLSWQEAVKIASSIASILKDLHHHRIVHKDIKPANILIHPESREIRLIDFSIASLLPKETQTLKNPTELEGTLAYISPEQTGRTNRGIDYRSDFYSLGVTLFELLTHTLPFPSQDVMELVHCHLAKQPPRADAINLEIPAIVADIVEKLMAKNAEERYQSALGLQWDLETCLTQWRETGHVEAFELGERDRCDRFLIPEKLYGRQREVRTLL